MRPSGLLRMNVCPVRLSLLANCETFERRVSMKKLLTAVATAIASFATSIAAQAADLPMEPVYKAPVVVAAVYNWTGFYIGANAGYGWGNQDPFSVLTNRFDAFSVPFSGWMLGGTVGAQIQSGHVVLGVEADLDWSKITGSATVIPTIGGALPSGCVGLVNCKTSLTPTSTTSAPVDCVSGTHSTIGCFMRPGVWRCSVPTPTSRRSVV